MQEKASSDAIERTTSSSGSGEGDVVSAAGTIGFLLFGYDQGVLGGINTSEDFLNQFNDPSDTLLGTINAIYE